MKKLTPLFVSCFAGLACMAAFLMKTTVAADAPPTAPAGGFRAGFAEKDITPDIGMEAPGGYGKALHGAFHDACKARAEIAKRCGIPGDSVMIGASHSHSSGPIGMSEPGDFDQASELVKDLATNKTIVSNPGFDQMLLRQIVEAVVQADGAKTPAKLAVGFGHEDKVSFNRRLRMKNGQTWSHPGAGNPDIIDYAGPIDPQVGTVGVWDLKNNLLGVVVNFACHATTNPGGISANWIWSMEKTLRGATGNAALPVVFLQGACGDITQVDNLTKTANPGAEEWCELVGGVERGRRRGSFDWRVRSRCRRTDGQRRPPGCCRR